MGPTAPFWPFAGDPARASNTQEANLFGGGLGTPNARLSLGR